MHQMLSNPIHVLAIDDEPDLCALTKEFLEMSGAIKVDLAYSVTEARTSLSKNCYHAIVSDYQMPEEDGIQFLKSLRTAGDKTPFILFTGKGREEVVIEALNNGADAYLQKGGMPAPMYTELEHRIKNVVWRYRSEEARRDSESRLQHAEEIAGLGHWQIDLTEKTITGSHGAILVCGLDKPKLSLADWQKIPLPEYRSSLDQSLKDLIEKGKPYDVDAKIRRPSDGEIIDIRSLAEYDPDKKMVFGVLQDITVRKRAEDYFNLGREIMKNLIQPGTLKDSLQHVIGTLKASTGADAVGIRLLDGNDFPYYSQEGFSEDFLRMENSLLDQGSGGVTFEDADGDRSLACMCGLVISGKTDPSNSLFTRGGSAWTNDSFLFMDLPAKKDPRAHPRNECMRQGHASIAWIPIRVKGHIEGLLQLNYRRKWGFTLEAVESLEVIAENIGEVLSRRQAEEALHRQSATLSILNDIISKANQADDLPHLLDTILDESLHLLDFDAGGIYLVDRSKRTADVVCSKNLTPEFLSGIQTVSIDEKPYNTLFINNEPIITENYALINPERSKRFGFRSMASIPLLSKGLAIGALNISSMRRHRISAEDKQTLISISRELGSTIERMMAEQEARKSSKNLQILFNSIDEMVFVLDMQGRILEVNDAVQKRLLYSPEELTDKNVMILHVPERREEALQIVQGMIAGTIDLCSVPVKAKDGTCIEVETKVTRGWWNNQEVLIGVTRDVSERKRAEKALHQSEEKYRLLIENSHDIIYTITKDGIFTFVSPSWTTILGHPVDQVVGRPFQSFVHPDDLAGCMAFLNRAIGKGQRQTGVEYRVRHNNGSWRWHTSSAVTLMDETGAAVGIEGIASDITVQKMAEDALRESEKRYHLLVESAVESVVVAQDGMLRFVNPATVKLLGFSEQDLTTTPFLGHIHPDDRAMVEERHEKRARGEIVPDRYIFRVLTKEGAVRTVELISVDIDWDGRYANLDFLTDVTERKQAEDALHEISDRLKLATQAGGVGIWDYDVVKNELKLDEQMFRLYGITREQFSGVYEDWLASLLSEDKEMGDREILMALRGEKEFNIEFRVRWPDGTIHNIRARALVQRDVSGRPLRMIGTNWDITAQKQMEERLKESTERFKQMAEIFRETIFEADLDGKVTYVNDHGLMTFGFEGTDVDAGVNLYDLVVPSDRQGVHSRISGRIRGEKGDYLEYKALRKDGETFDALAFAGPIIRNGNIIGIRGFILDISQRKMTEEALKQANIKLNLLSNITRHDINNQTIALKGNLALLEHNNPQLASDEHLRTAEKVAGRISAMVRFTKEYEDIGVHAPIWQDVGTLVSTGAKEVPLGAAEVINDVPAGTRVFADPLIVKVFHNLMENAVRHGGQVTTIHFSLKERDGLRCIVCEDDGSGIAADMKERLFTKGFGKEHGLGLFLSREILSITGITITEEGEPGKGAKFVMTMPANWNKKPADIN